MIKSSNHTPLPKAGEGKRGGNGYLGYLLRQAANTYRYRVESALSDLPLTQPQFSALVMLEAYPDHSSADLARMAFLTPQTMSVIVSNLSKSGLITRSPHAAHGRKQHIALTELGHETLRAAKERVYALEKDLLAGVSDDEAATIRHWLVSLL